MRSELLIKAYREYKETSLLKTELVSDNTNMLAGHFSLLEELDRQISILIEDKKWIKVFN